MSNERHTMPELIEALEAVGFKQPCNKAAWKIIAYQEIEITELNLTTCSNLHQLNRLIRKRLNMGADTLRKDLNSGLMNKRREYLKRNRK